MPEHEDGTVEKIEDLSEPEEGDRVLFDDRAVPLIIEETGDHEIFVEGPHGGKYRIYEKEDAKHFLIAKPGKERYASYCRNLRRVGEWVKENEKSWTHTDTEARVGIVKNQGGFWTLEIEELDEDPDIPKYGFSSFEHALEEAKGILDKNPEG